MVDRSPWVGDIFNYMVEQSGPELDLVFHALADGTRRALLHTISQNKLSVGELAAPYAMSLAAVSKHLDVLERAALIRRERQGKSRMVSLNPHPLEAAQDWLAFYDQYWSDGLDRLQATLEEKEQ
jgi:DNA-binding transcriptional ArsR family regulator